MSQKTLKLKATVNPEGKLGLEVPFPPGTRLEVVVLPPDRETFDDLLRAAESSTDFWDNPLDAEEWKDA